MKAILIMITMLTALLLSGCSLFEDKEKAFEIIRLQTALASQQGTRTAEIEYAERQVAFYLGCKRFFNSCSPETTERGKKLLANGFSGTTSVWYWVGYLGAPVCIATALGVFLAVLSAVSSYLNLKAIEPKKAEVEQKKLLIYTAEARAKAANLRGNELEKRNGLLRRANHAVAHPPKMRSESPSMPTILLFPRVHNNDPSAVPPPKKQEDY